MKEITTEYIMRVTVIERMEDVIADSKVLKDRETETRRITANNIKKLLGADDVQITGIKDFVRDIEEE